MPGPPVLTNGYGGLSMTQVPDIWSVVRLSSVRSSASSRAKPLGHRRIVRSIWGCTILSGRFRGPRLGRYGVGARAKRSFEDMRSPAELGTEYSSRELRVDDLLQQAQRRLQRGLRDRMSAGELDELYD